MKKGIIVLIIIAVVVVALVTYFNAQKRVPEAQMPQSAVPAVTIDDYAQEPAAAPDAAVIAPAEDSSSAILNEIEQVDLGGEVDSEFKAIDRDLENL